MHVHPSSDPRDNSDLHEFRRCRLLSGTGVEQMSASLTKHFKNGKRVLKDLPAVTQLSPLVWRFLGCNPGSYTLTGTNTYLVGNGPDRILIDAGEGHADYLINLREGMGQAGCSRISEIVITHWHHDHLGGVPSIIDIFGPIAIRKFMPLEREEMFGGEGSVDPYSLYPKEKFIPILDGDTIKTQGAHLKVFHTPGHANDHIVLMLEEENAMFTADNVLGIGTTVFRDLKTYMNSLRVMAAMSPARLYPGHGPVVENGSSKIAEYIDHRLTRIKATISVLGKQPPGDAEAWTLESLTRTMYSEIPEHLVWPAMVNTLLVLTALRQDGIVTTVFSPSETAADVHHIVPSRSWQLSLSEEKAHALVADLSSKM